MSDDYKLLESNKVFEGHIFKIFVDKVMMPSGRVVEREILSHAGAVGIVPVTADNEVILVEQYRHAAGRRIWEIPAGKLDGDEDPLDCAVRELREETGATASEIKELAEFYNAPGYSDERFFLYLARVVNLSAPQPDGDEEEDINIAVLPIKSALEKIKEGEIRDAKTIIGLLMADRELG